MIKKMTAIIAAAVCAGFMVTLVPGLAPEVAVGAPRPVDQIVSSAVPAYLPAQVSASTVTGTRESLGQDIRNDHRGSKNACAQSWPYYERSCLRDERQVDGSARIVRVIAVDRSAAMPLRR
jgi:hypothetical protein